MIVVARRKARLALWRSIAGSSSSNDLQSCSARTRHVPHCMDSTNIPSHHLHAELALKTHVMHALVDRYGRARVALSALGPPNAGSEARLTAFYEDN
jgi:hypothetical protein